MEGAACRTFAPPRNGRTAMWKVPRSFGEVSGPLGRILSVNAPARLTLVCNRGGGVSVCAAGSVRGLRAAGRRWFLLLQGQDRELLPQVPSARLASRLIRTRVFVARLLRAVPGIGAQQPACCRDGRPPGAVRGTGSCRCPGSRVVRLDALRPPRLGPFRASSSFRRLIRPFHIWVYWEACARLRVN